MAPLEPAATTMDAAPGASFSLVKQTLELDFSFCPRRVRGKTTLELQPNSPQFREISLHCRQLRPTRILLEGQPAAFTYSNLHQRMTLRPDTGLAQYHFPRGRITRHSADVEDELVIAVSDRIKVREVRPEEAGMAADAVGTFYALLKLEIEYILDDFRDALHFAGVEDGDPRFPHVYTRNSPFPGTASCLFPCIDDGTTRTFFEISIRYPRTLADALRPISMSRLDVDEMGIESDSDAQGFEYNGIDLSEEEKAMEMQVICSGVLTDDIIDPTDNTYKTASFSCDSLVLPQHIGFVIGPFEHVDLSDYRDLADEERLAESAIKVHAFCLPGREEEVRNSAMILARALDHFTQRFQTYDYGNAFKLAFVDDLDCDTIHTASFSICSSRLLFPETVWEPLEHTTRVLVHAVASQWIGVDIIAHSPRDYWIIVGGSWFMAELYLRELFGRNDWRFRQKRMVDKVIKLDVKRPSLTQMGDYLQLDPAEQEFMQMKALMVLAILHNRLVKQSGKNGVDRCLFRMLFNARQGKYTNGEITTEDFLEICEKVGHQKLDTFFNQWVLHSGCPSFECFPSFNKKKQVVQLQIRQTQADATITAIENPLTATDFMREAKEKARYMGPVNEYPTFVGPMTIRIHEADGTPYEHIVDINSSNVKVEIPYNTKYKRLKRNRLNKERMAAAQGLDTSGDTQEDITFYTLGDVLTSPEEIAEWRLDDWPAEDEAKQEQEAYEWIRVDADFEWICRAHINDMPSYMYVSQLQQDKDVVAQAESIQFLANKQGHRLISTFLVKTLMDNRYFHGIRTMAAEVMAQSALRQTDWIGLFHLQKAFRELFCEPGTGSPVTRQNDFSDRAMYLIQCAIPQAIAKIKGEDGKTPLEAKRFLLDVIRCNNNRGNDFSDDYYFSSLLRCLAESLSTTRAGIDPTQDLHGEAEEFDFTKKAIDELTRHQRVDEWIPTYQNILTTSALDAAMRLNLNRVIPFRPSEFLQYTQLGNADNVRLRAWECLAQLGLFRKDAIVKFLIHEVQSDPSPWFRKQLLRVLALAMGHVAVGDVYTPVKPVEDTLGSLIVEDDSNSAERAFAIGRQQLAGALKGLRRDLKDNKALFEALQCALRSNTLSIGDMSELLEMCELIYSDQKRDYLPVVLRYPRYWGVQHVGQGRLTFRRTEKVRLRATRPWPNPASGQPLKETVPQPGLPPPKTKLSLKIGASKSKSALSPPLHHAAAYSPSQNLFSPTAVMNSPQTVSAAVSPTSIPLPQPPKVEVSVSDGRVPSRSPKLAQEGILLETSHTQPVSPVVPLISQPTPKSSQTNVASTTSASSPALPLPSTQISTPPLSTQISTQLPKPSLKVKLKTRPVTTNTNTTARINHTASPRPIVPPSSAASTRPSPAIPAPASGPRQSKTKKSLVVKLLMRSETLAKFAIERTRKRKMLSADEERPHKRQSLDPNSLVTGSEGRKLVTVEKHGGNDPRLLLKLRVGSSRLSALER